MPLRPINRASKKSQASAFSAFPTSNRRHSLLLLRLVTF